MRHLAAATFILLIGFVLLAAMPLRAAEETDPAKLLATPGHFGLIRHATAPGTGDPEGFRLDDCATQRNLSDSGRAESRAIGQTLRDKGVARARVRSSQWCRCLETARLLGLGEVEPWPLLNSYFGRPELGPARISDLKAALTTLDLSTPLVLVTHQVVILGLVGTSVSSGETVVVRRNPDGELAIAGRVPPPR